MQRRNNAIKINSRQRHANNNKKEKRTSAKYLYDYYGNLSEVAAALSTSLPLAQSHMST
jgi:hypothetical protein